ncbi:C6 transcription factor [Colletotrichum plurivorum]|uniref:C6 transcription factor n=1 Tax=Colletotrichum plurivorum TaxID=2175906 RepID=A0A8H6N9W0_9PEZI|nr:C6 transcription factor [Colletotrichum plurivorum]
MSNGPQTSPQACSLDEAALPLRFVSPAHEEPKKKKAHRKSRGGCRACKKRRVKCDEKHPCGNCLRRNEACQPSQQSTPPEMEASTPPAPLQRPPLDPCGPVNLLHMELFHHFQHVTAPTLCFSEAWASALPLAFNEEYLMTAMLAASARHISTLRPQEHVYAQAAMALLSRSCAAFIEVLEKHDDSGDKCDPLFFTAMLIHHLTWCNLTFLEDQAVSGVTDTPLDLTGDQLFLLSSGPRTFLSSTRARGPESVFADMSSTSQCGALEAIVEAQGWDCDAIVDCFMDRYDEITAQEEKYQPDNTRIPGTDLSIQRDDGRRSSYKAIVRRLSVPIALLQHKLSNPTPPQASDIERFIFSFPLFFFGPILDMTASGDSRALLVLYHFYRTSRLLLGHRQWWASERLETMEALIKQELERRDVGVSVKVVEP